MPSLPQIKNQYYFHHLELAPKMTLGPELTFQMRKVLRLKPKALVMLQDGKGTQALYELKKTDPFAEVTLLEKITRPAPPSITLIQSLLKKDKTEWLLQKATELGASEIWLWESHYSEQKIASFETKLPRLQKIIQEAFEQSRSYYLPKLILFPSLDKILSALNPVAEKYLLDPEASQTFLDTHALPGYLFTGPEGGFSELELKLISKIPRLQSIKLSAQTLRAETAALAALSQLRLF